MVDRACSDETENEIVVCAREQAGVTSVSGIHTRMFANKIYVEIDVCADGKMALSGANEIADRVHDAIENKFSKIKHISVRVKPE